MTDQERQQLENILHSYSAYPGMIVKPGSQDVWFLLDLVRRQEIEIEGWERLGKSQSEALKIAVYNIQSLMNQPPNVVMGASLMSASLCDCVPSQCQTCNKKLGKGRCFPPPGFSSRAEAFPNEYCQCSNK